MTKMNIGKAIFTLSMATLLGFGVEWAFTVPAKAEGNVTEDIGYFEARLKVVSGSTVDTQYFEHIEFNEHLGEIYVREVLEDELGQPIEEKSEYYVRASLSYIHLFFIEGGSNKLLLDDARPYQIFNGSAIQSGTGTMSISETPAEESDELKTYAKTIIPMVGLGLFMLWAFPASGGIDKGSKNKSNSSKAMIKKDKPKKAYNTILGQSTVKTNVKSFLDIFMNPESYEKSKVELPNGLFISSADDFRKNEFIEVVASEMKATLYTVSANDIALQSGDDAVKTIKTLYSKTRFNKKAIIHIDRIDALYNSGTVEQKVFDELKTLVDKTAKSRKTIIVLSSNSDDIRNNKDFDKLNIAGYLGIPELSPKDREAIFKAALKDARVSKDVDYEELSKATIGFNDEKINRIVNQSLLRSVSNGNGILKMSDIKRILKTTE